MEKKITITINEDNSLSIEYSNKFSLMENVGILEASKTILLSEYVNPMKNNIYSPTNSETIYNSSPLGGGNIR